MKQRNQEEATTSINTRSDMSTRFSFDSRRLILICVLLFASARRGVESFLLIRPSPSQHQATSIRLQTSTIIPSRRLVGEKKQYNLLKSTSTLLQVLSSEVYDADKQVKNKPSRSSQTILSSKTTSSAAAADDPEWKFFDTARIHVTGGDGGSGCVAFRREKGEARGGPNGGRGGSGGSVVLVCDNGLNTLLPLHQRVHVRASKGRNGQGKNKDGICAHDVEIAVPPGTVVRDLVTQKLAGELRVHGERLVVARGGRGGRGNFAFKTPQRTAPKLAERGEPGVSRWLSIELRLLADVGFLGVPNAGKSTLLAAASAARPKIANYPFTTIVPNLGVCDLGQGAGLVLCDIPGLIQGASHGAGMGLAFLRHVQRCKVLLHVVDGSSLDPIADFNTINDELALYDPFLAQKPQVVVLNKMDIPEVRERADELVAALKQAAGHSRVLTISAATTERVQELMGRLQKFVQAQAVVELPPPPPEIDLGRAGLEHDSDAYKIESDPSYPGQWRVTGKYIEQIARMTHWEYPEAVERFGRQLDALGISRELTQRGAEEGDLVMIGVYDFEFSPDMKNPYIPPDLLDGMGMSGRSSRRSRRSAEKMGGEPTTEEVRPWRPFRQGGFLDIDVDELEGFGEEDWETLEYNDSIDDGLDEDGRFVDFEADFPGASP